MARTMFTATVVLKMLMYAVMWFGVYLGVRALIDDRIGFGLLILFVGIPLALWATGLVLGIAQLVVLFPLALLLGKRREYMEYSNFTVAIVDVLGTDRLKLRQGRIILGMFNELPPPSPGAPARSGDELVELYEELHADDDEETPEPSPVPG